MRFSGAGLICISALIAPAFTQANDLIDAYHLAQEQDQTFQVALHQRDATLEAAPQAWSSLIPQLGAKGGYGRNRSNVLANGVTAATVQYYNNPNYSVILSQTVFDWSAFQTLAQAHKQAAQAEAAYRSAEQSLIARTATAYFTVLAAEDTQRADLETQAAFKTQLDQAQGKYQVGLAPITDVRNAQASYDTSKATIIIDRTLLDNAKRALGVIIGKPVDQVAPLRESIPLPWPEPRAVEAWSYAAQDNSDLLGARMAAEAAQKQVEVYRGKYLPTVNAFGSVGRQNAPADLGGDTITDAVGVNVNWNLFQGGLVGSQVRQARAAYEQAQSQYELQRRSVDQSTRNDYEGVISGISAVQASWQAVLSNQLSLEATEAGLQAGRRTEIDVLNARQALAAAQKTYYQSRYNYLNSTLALKQDAGRLLEYDLQDIDHLLEAPAKPSGSAPESAPGPAPKS